MALKITERILGMFHRLNYEIMVLNGETEIIDYRNADHIPRIGEVIGVPVQCDRHSKGTSFLTVRDVFYSSNGLPRVIVDRNELRSKSKTDNK